MKNINKLAKVIAMTGATGLAMASTTFASSNGLSSVFPKDGLLGSSLDMQNVVNIGFRLLIAGVIAWVVYNIVLAGMKIAGAKDDPEKRKKGLQSIINASLGLIVALAAFAIVNTLTKQITGEPPTTAIGLPCKYKDSSGNIKLGIKTEDGCTDENGDSHDETP